MPRGIRRLLRLRRTRAAILGEIDEELASLLDARIEALTAQGMSPTDAHAEAMRRLGATLDQARAQLHRSATLRHRRMRIRDLFDDFWHDVRYGARGLLRRPAFTIVAVATLAIGIGATTTIFSAVNTLLLRPLPYDRPNELMLVSLEAPSVGGRPGEPVEIWSYPKAQEFRRRQTVFSDLAYYSWEPATITGGEPELTRVEHVTASYLPLLGIKPAVGRGFDRLLDDRPEVAQEVILSDALWQRRFKANRDIIGTALHLDGVPYTIVGVLPPGFLGLTGQGNLLVPITAGTTRRLSQPQNHWLDMVARRKAGVTDAQMRVTVAQLGREINEIFLTADMSGAPWGANARPLDAVRVAPLIKQSLLILFAAVAFVLLIACTNVANLLIGRASTRHREIAVRLAIGASRGRLVRLLLAESSLLAALGACAGLAIAAIGIRALAAVDPIALRMPRFDGVGGLALSFVALDWAALAFAVGLTVIVGTAFGLVPALQATRASLADAMKDGGAKLGHGTSASRRILVVVEVAMALVLLVSSGLMIHSLSKLLSVDPGFDARNVLTVRLTIPPRGMAQDSMPAFHSEVLARLRGLPGVTSVSLSSCVPLGGGCSQTLIESMDRDPVPESQRPRVEVDWVTPDWFNTVGVPLRHGRGFNATDGVAAPKVVVINEASAKKFWPNADPIGKRIGLGVDDLEEGAEVIGVVGDVRQLADSSAMPAAYVSYLQSPRPTAMVFVKSTRNIATLGPEVRRALREVAPIFPIHDMQLLTERVGAATARTRFSAVLLTLFAATALSLAAMGLYGVMSLAVTARTREIGIRMALGADQRRVQRAIVGEAVALVSVGAAFGLVMAIMATRALRSLLFDLTPTDPATYGAILALLAGAAIIASWLPSRRAARVDPVDALRAE